MNIFKIDSFSQVTATIPTIGGECLPFYPTKTASFAQKFQQIERVFNRFLLTQCSGRDFSEDLVSIPGFKDARTKPEREALRHVYEAQCLEANDFNEPRIHDLYFWTIQKLNQLKRSSYTLKEYISLQELKVSCQEFISEYPGPIGQIILHSYLLELADLYKERSKYKDPAAPFYLIRSAEIRLKAEEGFYDREEAAHCLEETIYDLRAIPRNSSIWAPHIDKIDILLTVAGNKHKALQNPSVFQRIGNVFMKTYGWIYKQI